MPVLVGQVYTSSIDVVGNDDLPAVPATAQCTITRLGSPDAPTVLALSPTTPHLSVDYVMPAEGLYRFDWMTTTPGTPQTDYVTCRAFLSVISLAEAREYLGVQDRRRDPVLQSLMATATRLAEKICGTIVPRTFTNDWIASPLAASKPVIQVPHGPILDSGDPDVQIRSTQAGGPSWGAPDLLINAECGTLYPRNYIPFWLGPWLGTYPAGRLVPGENIINGVREILSDLWGTQRWVTGDTDQPDLTELAVYEQMTGGEYRMPGRASELLEPERYVSFG